MKKKRFLGILLSFALMLTMMPVLSQTAYAEIPAPVLYVGEDPVNMNEECSGTGWAFTPASGEGNAVLTLKDADITTGYTLSGIYYNGSAPLDIVLDTETGFNVAENLAFGIFSSDAVISVSGEGTFNVSNGTIVAKDLMINGGTVNASTKRANGAAISAAGVTITGGTVNASGTGDSGYGIYSTNSVKITGGMLTAEGDFAAISFSPGIDASSGIMIKAGASKEKAEYVDEYTAQKWVKAGEPVDRNVHFFAVNGAFNNGIRNATASMHGFEEDMILNAELIPAAGGKPDQGYKAGSWDVAPVAGSLITENATYTYTYAKDDTPTPGPGPAPGTAPSSDPTAVGTTHAVDGSIYVVTAPDTVSLVKAAGKKSYTVPGTVQLYGKSFTVTGIYARAFRETKVKTLTVKTRMLTKRSVRGSLKGSKVKTVKVKVGKKKINKKYVKKYKKYFTKKNAGRRVSVR